jgi:hypothetical protein
VVDTVIEGVTLMDGVALILTEGVEDIVMLGVTEILGVTESEGVLDTLGVMDTLGVTDIDGVTEMLGVNEGVTDTEGVAEGIPTVFNPGSIKLTLLP